MRIPHPHLSGRTKLAMVGTAFGAAVTYIVSNPTLRKELQKADSAKEAAEIIGRHVKRDSQDLSEEVHDYMHSPAMQTRWKSMKRWISSKTAGVQKKAEQVKNRVAKEVAKRSEKKVTAAKQRASSVI